jgi:hypothetical protein
MKCVNISHFLAGKLWIGDSNVSWRQETQRDEDRTAALHARLGIGTGRSTQHIPTLTVISLAGQSVTPTLIAHSQRLHEIENIVKMALRTSVIYTSLRVHYYFHKLRWKPVSEKLVKGKLSCRIVILDAYYEGYFLRLTFDTNAKNFLNNELTSFLHFLTVLGPAHPRMFE